MSSPGPLGYRPDTLLPHEEFPLEPKSFSATALATYKGCPARYKAEVIDRVPDIDGDAALLGTTCHSALEDFVASGEAQRGEALLVLENHFTEHYWRNFSNDDRLAEGLAMMKRWHKRQEWTDILVLSTEVKECIMVPTSIGEIPFNFIIDRLDMNERTGAVIVVDYKSNWVPMTFDDLRQLPQPQLYGMVARMKFPEAEEIWVKFDFLRHDAVGIKVSKEDNRNAWEFLKGTAEQIIADDGTTERLNKDCVWCVRSHVCEAMQANISGGGVMSVAADIPSAARRHHELTVAQKVIKKQLEDVDGILTSHMEHEGMAEFDTDEVSVSLSAGRRRQVDGPIVAKIVGAETFAKYAVIGVGKVEDMIKNEPLTPEQTTAIEQNIHWRFNRVGVKVKPKGPLDGED